MQKNKLKERELEVLQAMEILAKYRANNGSADDGFTRIWLLIHLLLETATEPLKCDKCGSELHLYVNIK